MSQYLKQSKFIHVLRGKNFACLYHSLTMDIVFVTTKYLNIFEKYQIAKRIESNNTKPHFLKLLTRKNFLVNENKDKVSIRNLRTNLPKPNYTLLRVLMTNNCNLNCRYCKVKFNLKTKTVEIIKENDIRNILKQFQELSPRFKKLVSITGGEPLLYFNEVKKIIELCKKELKNYWIVLFTNATLLNKNIVEYLKKENILTVISVDGRKSHDRIRVFRNKQGSYDLIKKNLNLLKRNGVKIGVSCVVGKHNIDNLFDDFKYIIDKFNPQSIGLNPLKYPSPKDFNFNLLINPKRYVKEVYRLFKIARKRGIFIEQINRKLLPFTKQEFKFYECGACGGKNINIDANGNIGPCKSYLVMKKLYQKSSVAIRSSMVFKKLSERSPIFNNNCLSCPGIGICGGGCSYEAFVETGNILEFSERSCKVTKSFLELMFLDLFVLNRKIINKNLSKIGYYLIKRKEREKMYGKIKILPKTLKYSVGHK